MSTKIYYCHYFFKISYIINTFIIIINKKHVKNSWISFVINPTMWISLPRSKWDGLPPTYWMVALFIQLYSRITIRGTEKFNVNETENDMTQSAKRKKKKKVLSTVVPITNGICYKFVRLLFHIPIFFLLQFPIYVFFNKGFLVYTIR